MALIDDLKEQRKEAKASLNLQEAFVVAHQSNVQEWLATIADLDLAIAALEAPAQPVHPDELRTDPGSVEEVRDQSCTCHPDDAPPECQHKYAASECRAAWDADLPTPDDVRGILSEADPLLTALEDDHIVERAPIIDAQTREEVDPRVSWKAEPEIPEGFTKWEGGGYAAFCEKHPDRDNMEIEVIFRNGERFRGVPAGFAWSSAEELLGSGWRHEDAVGGKITDADDIIAYRILEAPAPEQDALGGTYDGGFDEAEPELSAGELYALGRDDRLAEMSGPARDEPAYLDGYHTPAPEDASVEIEQEADIQYLNKPEPGPYDAAVEKGAITQDEADLLEAAKAEQARFFAEGMMADADRHQSDQRGIVGVLTGMFKREREDA